MRLDGARSRQAVLEWQILYRRQRDRIGEPEHVPGVAHDSILTDSLTIAFPEQLPEDKAACAVVLTLKQDAAIIATNAYDVMLARRPWASLPASPAAERGSALFDLTGKTRALFDSVLVSGTSS